MSGKRIGYVRVSTPEQNPERQLEGISIDRKFIDFASARSLDRPQLKLMLDFVREDDVIFIHSMDRLARNVNDLKKIVKHLVSQNIQVHFVKENLIFDGDDSPMSNLLLHLMGAFAEFEYQFIRERQREGIAIAKRKGRYKPPPRKLNEEKIATLRDLLLNTRKSKAAIARELGVSRFTLYKYIKQEKIL